MRRTRFAIALALAALSPPVSRTAAASASCVGHCGSSSTSSPSSGVTQPLCYCDSECTKFGDCCIDYAPVCGPTPTGIHLVTDASSCVALHVSPGASNLNPTMPIQYSQSGACNAFPAGKEGDEWALLSCPLNRSGYAGANANGVGIKHASSRLYVKDQSPTSQIKCDIRALTATGGVYYSSIKYSCSKPGGCSTQKGPGVVRRPDPEPEASFVGTARLDWNGSDALAGGQRIDEDVVNVNFHCEVPPTPPSGSDSCVLGGASYVAGP